MGSSLFCGDVMESANTGAALRAFADRTKQLKERRVRLLGERVIVTGADALTDAELAGALAEIAETKDASKREAWARRGEEKFRKHARTRVRSEDDSTRDPANDDNAQPASGDDHATIAIACVLK
jgi:hypothetical protein